MREKPNFFVLMVCMALSCLLSGWILKVMWMWFIVPLGIMPLSLAHAIGMDSLLTIYRYHSNSNNDDREWYIKFAGTTFVYMILLLVGFVAHTFM